MAAANKHTAILTDAGAIFSWGSNDQGQLGYGTSDSASNALPRQVEAMKVSNDMALSAFEAANVFEVCDAFVLMQDLFVILGMFVSDHSFESL